MPKHYRLFQATPWHRLGERTRIMLQSVNATTFIREADLALLIWPTLVSRQAQEEAFGRWQQRRYVQSISELGDSYVQLDVVGAKILHNAGVAQIASTRACKPATRTGMVVANRIGVGTITASRHDPRVTAVHWNAQPFRGDLVRADGIAYVQYTTISQAVTQWSIASWLPELANTSYVPPAGQSLQRLVIEIDNTTQTQRQLAERAKRWRAYWESTPCFAASDTVFLWITTGSQARLNTIWEAWIGHAFLPAFFTTMHEFAVDGQYWQPWEPLRSEQGRYRWIWRDLYGRPRSLKPWEMNEPVWRSESMRPVTMPSWSSSVRAWQ
jgi:hypothetical protein